MASRGRPTGKAAGNVTAFKADSEFLGAEDIMGRVPVPIRVVAVLTYPKGYMVAGRPAAKAFPVIVYERQDENGEWVLGKKRWIVTSTEVRQALIVRAESVHAPHWIGLEVELRAKVCKSPKGGLTWGVRVKPRPDELNESTLKEKMRRAAERLPPGIEAATEPSPRREDPPGEDDENRDEPPDPPPPEEVEEPERFDDEPPDDWRGEVQAV